MRSSWKWQILTGYWTIWHSHSQGLFPTPALSSLGLRGREKALGMRMTEWKSAPWPKCSCVSTKTELWIFCCGQPFVCHVWLPRNRSLSTQPISIRKTQSRKKSPQTFAHIVHFSRNVLKKCSKNRLCIWKNFAHTWTFQYRPWKGDQFLFGVENKRRKNYGCCLYSKFSGVLIGIRQGRGGEHLLETGRSLKKARATRGAYWTQGACWNFYTPNVPANLHPPSPAHSDTAPLFARVSSISIY